MLLGGTRKAAPSGTASRAAHTISRLSESAAAPGFCFQMILRVHRHQKQQMAPTTNTAPITSPAMEPESVMEPVWPTWYAREVVEGEGLYSTTVVATGLKAEAAAAAVMAAASAAVLWPVKAASVPRLAGACSVATRRSAAAGLARLALRQQP